MRTTDKQVVENEVVQRIIKLLNEQGHSQRELIDFIGLSNGAFTGWKYGRGKSYITHINKIADFLNVTPNYLLTGADDNKNDFTVGELEMIKMFRELDEEAKYIYRKQLKMIWEAQTILSQKDDVYRKQMKLFWESQHGNEDVLAEGLVDIDDSEE